MITSIKYLLTSLLLLAATAILVVYVLDKTGYDNALDEDVLISRGTYDRVTKELSGETYVITMHELAFFAPVKEPKVDCTAEKVTFTTKNEESAKLVMKYRPNTIDYIASSILAKGFTDVRQVEIDVLQQMTDKHEIDFIRSTQIKGLSCKSFVK